MRDICLPSEAVLTQAASAAPELRLDDRAIVLDRDEVSEEVAGVRFWMPTFLHASTDGLRRVLAAMPSLEVIQTQSAGVDNFIGRVPADVTLCDGRGIHGSSTSEWALTAILSVLRDFPRFERAQAEGRWEAGVTDELAGKRVLIVGAGDVGMQLERRLTACDAHSTLVARTARPGVHGVAELPELLPLADVVVLIVPKTAETVGMVDQAFLARLRDGALLVNAARGPVVQTDALLAELQSGRIRAALDVTDPEPLPADHPLWHAPNLLLTPHVAGSVLGLGDRVVRLLVDQLRRFDRGEPLINVVSGDY